MILLENVSSAPLLQWEEYWQVRGYVARAVILDTKDFYLPQTRVRGYMLAFEEMKARKIGLDCHDALDKWQNTLEGLLRRASSPFSSFLVHPDDREFERIRQEILTL
ncbi:MAG: hypothetical protein M1823_008095, partial [Watsoniomyces obsoletus]